MTASELTFAVVAAYDELDRARADFAAVEDLAAAHELHLDDAALLRHAVGHVEGERHDARSTTRVAGFTLVFLSAVSIRRWMPMPGAISTNRLATYGTG